MTKIRPWTIAALTACLAALLANCGTQNDAPQDEVATITLTPVDNAKTVSQALRAVTDATRVDSALNQIAIDGLIADAMLLAAEAAPRPSPTPAAPAGFATALRGILHGAGLPVSGPSQPSRRRLASRRMTATAAVSVACEAGGTATRKDETTAADQRDITIIYTDCQERTIDGSYRIHNGRLRVSNTGNDTTASVSMVLGGGDYAIDTAVDSLDLHTLDYDAAGNLTAERWSSAILTATTTYADDGNTGEFSFTANGSTQYLDRLLGRRDTALLRSLSLVTRFATANLQGADIQADGVVEAASDRNLDGRFDTSSYLGLDDYRLIKTVAGVNGDSYTMTMDGKLVIATLPVTCLDGAYLVQTKAPLHVENGVWTAGKLTINNTEIEVIRNGLLRVIANGTAMEVGTGNLTGVCPVQ